MRGLVDIRSTRMEIAWWGRNISRNCQLFLAHYRPVDAAAAASLRTLWKRNPRRRIGMVNLVFRKLPRCIATVFCPLNGYTGDRSSCAHAEAIGCQRLLGIVRILFHTVM